MISSLWCPHSWNDLIGDHDDDHDDAYDDGNDDDGDDGDQNDHL